MHTLGQRIREARNAAGMTQSELARYLGAKLDAVQSWERDLVRPSQERLAIMAERWGIQAPPTQPATTERRCLRCCGMFPSLWVGHRICDRCKEAVDWVAA